MYSPWKRPVHYVSMVKLLLPRSRASGETKKKKSVNALVHSDSCRVWNTGRGKNRFTISELFADERCTGAILDFLRTTKVGARVGRESRHRNRGRRKRRPTEVRCSFTYVIPFESFSLSLSLAPFPSFLPFISRLVGQAGRGQGELPRAAGGLLEVAADGEEKGLYIISS